MRYRADKRVSAPCSSPYRLIAGSGADGKGGHLSDKVFEIIQGFAAVQDYIVVHLDVPVDQDVAETHRPADGTRQRGSADAMLAQ